MAYRTLALALIAFLLAQPGATVAAPGAQGRSADCSTSEVRALRASFKSLYVKKAYRQAVDVFNRATCQLPLDGVSGDDTFYWIQSDLALAELKAGDAVSCLQRLAPLQDPMHGYLSRGLDADSAVAKAIDHNVERCQQAVDAEVAKLNSKPCPFSTKDALASVALPGTPGSCLVLVKARLLDWTLPADFTTPAVSEACPRVEIAVAGQRVRAALTIEGHKGPLSTVDACCGIVSMAAGAEREGITVAFGSTDMQHPCGGSGTAIFAPSGTYRLEGTRLRLLKDTTVSVH